MGALYKINIVDQLFVKCGMTVKPNIYKKYVDFCLEGDLRHNKLHHAIINHMEPGRGGGGAKNKTKQNKNKLDPPPPQQQQQINYPTSWKRHTLHAVMKTIRNTLDT